MQLRLQPYSKEIEEALLGCIIIEPEQFYAVEAYLVNKDVWYIVNNKRLWNILVQMSHNHEHIDVLTVSNNLNSQDKKDGMTSYWLTGLADDGFAPSKAIEYAKKVYENYLYRKTIEKTHEIQNRAYDGNSSVYPLIGETYSLLGEILDMRPSHGFDMSECLDKAMKEIKDGGGNMVKSGWSKIDKLSGGFTKGEITIVGGRPGHGKTTFLINLASQFVHRGYKVMLFNRELPMNEVVKKFICLESGKLSYRMVRNAEYTKADIEELVRVDKLLREIYTPDKFQMFDKIRDFEGASIEVRKFKPDVVIDDYIQLIQPPRGIDTRRLQLEAICHEYKWLAKAYSCVVVLASQLNRQLEYRGSGEPQLSDLAESGAIEQVAENVFFTHYQWKFKEDKKKNNSHKLKLIAKKVRYGETGSVMMGFDGDKCKMYGSYSEWEGQMPFN